MHKNFCATIRCNHCYSYQLYRSWLYLAKVSVATCIELCQLLLRIEDDELGNMNEGMAYGQVTAPSQKNPTSALDVVYETI